MVMREHPCPYLARLRDQYRLRGMWMTGVLLTKISLRLATAKNLLWKSCHQLSHTFLLHEKSCRRLEHPFLHHVVKPSPADDKKKLAVEKLSPHGDKKKHDVIHASSVGGNQKLAEERPLPTDVNFFLFGISLYRMGLEAICSTRSWLNVVIASAVSVRRRG